MNILHLTLKAKWFDMIARGEKKEEYREIKPYWDIRLKHKDYTHIKFNNGYSKNARSFLIEYLSLKTSLGIIEWGAPEYTPVYILRLGKIIEHNEQPIGALRISGDGQLERKMNNNKGANHVRWIPVSRLVWEAANGKVPPNHFVIFKPGMRTTEMDKITLDKLECVTRAENARRNSIWRHGREMGALYQLKGAITRQVNRIAKQTKELES